MSSTTQPDGSLCPHFLDLDEELLSQLASKVAKVRSENKELFEFTHQHITLFDALADDEVTIAEEEIYDLFGEYHKGNFVVVIEGNVGTGKSELCAYLSHRLREDDRPVLHIDKNADLLSIMAEEIPEFYEEQVGGELPGASNVRRLQRHVRTNRDTVARLVVSKAILNISDLDRTNVELDSEQRDQLEGFVSDKLTAISERGELATKVSFVDPGEIKTFDYLNVFEGRSTEEAAEAWNDSIWEAVRSEYDSPSMDQLLKRVGQEFGDDRPVLVFEDFSVSALDAEKLVRYMEDDSPENNWDFIVAGTQDSTEVLRTQTGVERFNFYRTNRPNSSSVLFLDESNCFDFIRPYIGYIKYLDRSVTYERDERNEVVAVNPPISDSLCDDCGFCDDSFRDIFPFNEAFLRRIYSGLDEGDKRPRQFVQGVFGVLSDYYNGIVDSPASSSELRGLENQISVADSVYEDENIRRLAKWYGVDRDDGRLEVDTRFVQAFGLDDRPVTELGIELESRGSSTVWLIPKPGDGGGQIEGGSLSEEGTEQRSPEEKKIDELRGHIDTWRNNPEADAAADLDVYMRRGLKDALEIVTGDWSLKNDGSLEYAIGGNEFPFVLSEDAVVEAHQLYISPQDFNPSDLLRLLEFGVYREMSPRSADEAELLGRVGTQLTGYARKWRESISGEYLGSGSNFYTVNAVKQTYEDLVLALYGLAVLLDDPWEPVTAERIAEAYIGSELRFDEQLRTALGDKLLADQVKDVERFMEQAGNIESLFEDHFAASDTVLDLPHIRELLGQGQPIEVLNGLKKGAVRDLPGKLRFGPRESLSDLCVTAYDSVKALSEVRNDEGARQATRLIDHELRGIEMEVAIDYIERIRTYDGVSPERKENLGKFSEFTQEELDEVLEACALREEILENLDDHASLHASLIGLKMLQHELVELMAHIDLPDVVARQDDSGFIKVSKRYVGE